MSMWYLKVSFYIDKKKIKIRDKKAKQGKKYFWGGKNIQSVALFHVVGIHIISLHISPIYLICSFVIYSGSIHTPVLCVS